MRKLNLFLLCQAKFSLFLLRPYFFFELHSFYVKGELICYLGSFFYGFSFTRNFRNCLKPESMSIEKEKMASQTGDRNFVQRSANGRRTRDTSNVPRATPTGEWNVNNQPKSRVFTSRRQRRWPSANSPCEQINGPQTHDEHPLPHFGGRLCTSEANIHQARPRFSSQTPLRNVKTATEAVEDSGNPDPGMKEHPIQKLYRTLANHPILNASEQGVVEDHDPAAKADNQVDTWEDNTQLDKRKLIVNYLPNYADEWFLRELCGGEEIGCLVDCRVVRRKAKGGVYGTSCGYAFLTYADVESAERAKAAFDKFKLISRSLPVGNNVDDVTVKELKVSYCRPSHAAYKDTNIFVTGIPCGWTREQVHELFSQHGPVIAEKTAPRGQCKCFEEEVETIDWAAQEPFKCEATDWAFIRYARRDSAEKAIQDCNGMQLSPTYPRTLRVTLANRCKNGLASF